MEELGPLDLGGDPITLTLDAVAEAMAGSADVECIGPQRRSRGPSVVAMARGKKKRIAMSITLKDINSGGLRGFAQEMRTALDRAETKPVCPTCGGPAHTEGG